MKQKKRLVSSSSISTSSSQNSCTSIEEQNDENQIKSKIVAAFRYNDKLKKFGIGFYQRLVEYNLLDKNIKDEPMPKIYEPSHEHNFYDALARLLESFTKSCCAVTFDGGKFLVAFNHLSETDIDNCTSQVSVKQSPLPKHATDLMVLNLHMTSIIKTVVALKKKGVEPAGATFRGGAWVDIGLTRIMLLTNILPFNNNNDAKVSGLIHNLLMRYMEFEKNSTSPPELMPKSFWQAFDATYNLAESIHRNKIPITLSQIDIFKRYLSDVVTVENFIATLPLGHPILENVDNKDMIFTIITEGMNDVHAEMRIFNHLLESKKDLSSCSTDSGVATYIGISKLCCAHCNLAMNTFGIEQLFNSSSQEKKPGTAGYHGKGYEWPLIEQLKNNSNFMRAFLGEELWKLYDSFQETEIVKNKQGTKFGSEKELALHAIQYICKLKMGELTRFKYNGAFLIGSRCLYSPESPALNNNIPYIDAFYDEETNMLYTEQNILDGKIEISSVSKMTRVKIQAPEQRNTPIFDKNISVSSSSYIRDTFGIYRPNILAQISGVETPCSFIISPDMFVPHDEFTFLVNRATMFYSTKDYIISFNLYCKALKLYEDNKNNIPYKQSTVAIMHYGLGMILVKLKKLESALQYLEKAQENMPDKTQYSDAVSKYTTGLFSNAVSSSHMTEQELPKCSLNTRKANP